MYVYLCSSVSSFGSESNLPKVTQRHNDLKTLEAQIEQLGSDHDAVNITVTQNFSEIEKKVERLQAQINYHQQKTEENVQNMASNVDNAFQKALEVQKSYEELQKPLTNQLSLTQQQLLDMQKANAHLQNQLSLTQQQLLDMQKANAHLQNQLSLTQQQLLGVHSMMTCSRLWVLSRDQYTIGKEIGRGSWATVHKTTFRGATVAAKCLHQLINAPRTRQLFQREMEMALQCQHQNIVTFLGATLEDPPVILMELMDTNLRNAYEHGNIKDHQVLGIFCDIASALHFLHTRPDPVIHRDVSSANVLLKDCDNEKWLAKLGDLGTAKLQQYCTTPGPGALAYAAPEVADPKHHSTKMDVYSFGVLVVEVLNKTLPFQNLNTLKSQVQQQFPQYHQLVTSCTNQQSSDRPTMYDVIGQLNKIKAARP